MRCRCTLFLALLPIAVAADAIDNIVNAEMKGTGLPGVAVAVIQNGKTLKVKGYGYANMEHKVPVKPETVFQSGSLGKQFTSALIMKLVEPESLAWRIPWSSGFPSPPESGMALRFGTC